MDTNQSTPDYGVEIKERNQLKKPPLYRVLLINDDFTTMDFVTHVLENIFHKSAVEAAQIMLHVHKQGKGIAGIYTYGIAETKIANVHELARLNDHPLKCIMEKE
ncbi:MAG: ATP-dependent Clp protease adapter ClpS [Nitrospira sp.]|nr:ATP-dependent Clp protease adapter ClpS [bacterium]MBL7049370.1 ATP-dependent Clp protease adapter ClpS [Nitrospira sp.]